MYQASSIRNKSEVQKVNSFDELFSHGSAQSNDDKPSSIEEAWQQFGNDDTLHHRVENKGMYDFTYLEAALSGKGCIPLPEAQDQDLLNSANCSASMWDWDAGHQTYYESAQTEQDMSATLEIDSGDDNAVSYEDDKIETKKPKKQKEQWKGCKLDVDQERCYQIYKQYTGCTNRKAAHRIRKKWSNEIKQMLESNDIDEVMKACHILGSRKPNNLLTIEETSTLVTRIQNEFGLTRKNGANIVRMGAIDFPKERKAELFSSDQEKFHAAYSILYKIYARHNHDRNIGNRARYCRKMKEMREIEKMDVKNSTDEKMERFS